MAKSSLSEAFSAGVGLALGMMMAQCMFRALMTREKPIRQVVLCLRCGHKNPVQYRFCAECGNPLYPPSLIHCVKCGVTMPQNINYCRICGSALRKPEN